jgi:hypothetical protein
VDLFRTERGSDAPRHEPLDSAVSDEETRDPSTGNVTGRARFERDCHPPILTGDQNSKYACPHGSITEQRHGFRIGIVLALKLTGLGAPFRESRVT